MLVGRMLTDKTLTQNPEGFVVQVYRITPTRRVLCFVLQLFLVAILNFNERNAQACGPVARLEPVVMQEALAVGNDSRLTHSQHCVATDQATWTQLWKSHLGLMPHAKSEKTPAVDFDQSVVVAIVEKPASKTSVLRIVEVHSDSGVMHVDYEQVSQTDAKIKKRPKNVFGYFSVNCGARNAIDKIVLRRRYENKHRVEFKEVGRYSVSGKTAAKDPVAGRSHANLPMLNIAFADEPGVGNYDGVVGSPNDVWNLVSVGTTAKDFLRNSDTSQNPARLRVTRHDGGWGITGNPGIFHGYIYDNCQCKDLETTILDMRNGRYRAYVYAHGDAPNQNANIELVVGGEPLGQKATANDGTHRYREKPLAEGIQYVTFEFTVHTGEDVKFISHRDGSEYSMFNAIQIVPINDDENGKTDSAAPIRPIKKTREIGRQ